jgi:hypothetical protein
MDDKLLFKKRLELIGKKFNRLLIVDIFKEPSKWNGSQARCLCECGTEKIIPIRYLFNGESTSCGCYKKEKFGTRYYPAKKSRIPLEPRLGSALSVFRRRYNDGNLLIEEFLELSQQNCYYCNIGPFNCYNTYKPMGVYSRDKKCGVSAKRIAEGNFVYNGLDRVDNNRKHDKDNVVPCCINCNRAKSNLSQKDFFELIYRIYKLHKL